jgi:hypothetical protein
MHVFFFLQTTLDEGLMIISIEQSLYFANMGQMKDNLRRIEQVCWASFCSLRADHAP